MIVGHIGGGSVGGYQVQRSVRLRAGNAANLSWTPSTSGNRKTFTLRRLVKRGALGARQVITCVRQSSTDYFIFEFQSNDTIQIITATSSTVRMQLVTTAVFRDPSAWYDLVFAYDSTPATPGANDVYLEVNGVRVTALSTATYPAQNTDAYYMVSGVAHHHGVLGNLASSYFDGYFAEFLDVSGSKLASTSFAEQDTATRMWVPKKYTGTYGTNGFYLDFSDITSTTTLGSDKSGNGNNWTANNISLTSGVTYDSMLDVPGLPWTDGGNGRGNYPVFNVLQPGPAASSGFGWGNQLVTWSATHGIVRVTAALPTSGKFYFESVVTNNTSGSSGVGINLTTEAAANTTSGPVAGEYGTYYYTGANLLYNNGSQSNIFSATVVAGDVLQCAVDIDNSKIWFGRNNVWSDGTTSGTTGNPSAGTNQTLSVSGAGLFPGIRAISNGGYINFGQRPFAYTPPTGFKALNTANLPDPTGAAAKPWEHFHITSVTKSGNTNFTLPWDATLYDTLFEVKRQNAAGSWYQIDGLRGYDKYLSSNSTAAETTDANVIGVSGTTITLKSTLPDGVYVITAWKAGLASARQTNTSGSITSTVSANTDAGFSIVTYTGGGANATVGHGVGAALAMLEVKQRTTASATSWYVWHASLTSAAYSVYLNSSSAQDGPNAVFWNNTAPTSTVFSIGTSTGVSASSGTFVAYCWADKPGYSKFSAYAGNASTDGTMGYAGFKPRRVRLKSAPSNYNWDMLDTTRSPYNVARARLIPNGTGGDETTYGVMDILSNGFKLRDTDVEWNASGATFIYSAFSEQHIKYANAR